jgi:hypothetical protein
MGLDTKTYWLTDRQSQCDFDFDFDWFDNPVRVRRKGKSQMWDSKIVPKDYDPRKTALARASGTYKRQTRPLVREGAPWNQERNCQTYSVFRTEIKIWS